MTVSNTLVAHVEQLVPQIEPNVSCMGATGKNAVSRVLLGSVSQFMLQTSPVPVLVVP